jgi:hypothetical protein
MAMSRRRRLLGLVISSLVVGILAAPGCGSDSNNPNVPPVTEDGSSDTTTGADGTTESDANVVGNDGTTGTDSTAPDDSGGPVVLPPGSIVLPDGGILLPDGGVIGIPDGGVVLPDGGGILLPDGGIVPPDAGTVVPDGGGTLPDGGTVVIGADGGVVCVQTTCQGKIYACGDCADNDGDGKIDMNDVGCLGPCDNTEEDLTLGIPGGNNAPCKADCYFDQDTGSGNDTCVWDHGCDPHELNPVYYPETQSGNMCSFNWNSTKVQGNGTCEEFYDTPGQPDTCHSFCGPLTPNGCDCFGCCTFPALSGISDPKQPPGVDAGAPSYVWLGSLDSNGNPSCTIDKVTDPTKCHPCTPVKDCLNTCEHCELCIGKTTLPADCKPPPPPPIPDGGVPVDGGTLLPDGGFQLPDGSVVKPDAAVPLPDGGVFQPDGSVTQPDGGKLADAGSGGDAGAICGGQICFSGAACGLACQPPCPTGQFCLTGCCTPNPR